ncbi:hypothetical protein chiPu_0024292, partial [Chiloscyllium punctatum]|nr:hypothetical protein [Chiloscyllium punctatum]
RVSECWNAADAVVARHCDGAFELKVVTEVMHTMVRAAALSTARCLGSLRFSKHSSARLLPFVKMGQLFTKLPEEKRQAALHFIRLLVFSPIDCFINSY